MPSQKVRSLSSRNHESEKAASGKGSLDILPVFSWKTWRNPWFGLRFSPVQKEKILEQFNGICSVQHTCEKEKASDSAKKKGAGNLCAFLISFTEGKKWIGASRSKWKTEPFPSPACFQPLFSLARASQPNLFPSTTVNCMKRRRGSCLNPGTSLIQRDSLTFTSRLFKHLFFSSKVYGVLAFLELCSAKRSNYSSLEVWESFPCWWTGQGFRVFLPLVCLALLWQ